ncbi:MAG: PilZ domain-containing protein [Thermodesulfobacteriota bacterium]
MTNMYPADDNRRQAVRVPSRILMRARLLSRAEYDAIVASYRRGISLYNQENLRDIHVYLGAQHALQKLQERDEDLAEFLRHIDAKMTRILESVSNAPSPLAEFSLTELNISGGGLAYDSEVAYAAGDKLETQIILLPDHSYLYCISQVVSCGRDQEKGTYRVACEFDLIMDNDRETLVQYIFRQQQLELRNRRLRKEQE